MNGQSTDNEPPHRVLVVEDDPEIAAMVADYLGSEGLETRIAFDGTAMDRQLRAAPADLIVLDVMLPGEDGLAIARRLRASGGPPIIMLTAAGSEAERVSGLEIGADDYITKPFSLRELLARVRAVLRRAGENPSAAHTAFVFDGWTLSPDVRELTDPSGASVALTGAEFGLLRVFCEHPRRVMTREQLLDLTHEHESAGFDRSIDTLVSRIRRKIERDARDPQYLKTVRLGGYLFAPKVVRR